MGAGVSVMGTSRVNCFDPEYITWMIGQNGGQLENKHLVQGPGQALDRGTLYVCSRAVTPSRTADDGSEPKAGLAD